MITLIVASTPDGIIGADGKLPWHYKADLQRFKRLTMGGTLIMGRRTWESLPGPLPGRRHIVLTNHPERPSKHPVDSCEYVTAWSDTWVTEIEEPVWICGGADIYEQALALGFVERIDYTMVPRVDVSGAKDVVRLGRRLRVALEYRGAPKINEDDPRLSHFTVDEAALTVVFETDV